MLSIVSFYSKYARALTSENGCLSGLGYYEDVFYSHNKLVGTARAKGVKSDSKVEEKVGLIVRYTLPSWSATLYFYIHAMPYLYTGIASRSRPRLDYKRLVSPPTLHDNAPCMTPQMSAILNCKGVRARVSPRSLARACSCISAVKSEHKGA